jgi:hypothetical protein
MEVAMDNIKDKIEKIMSCMDDISPNESIRHLEKVDAHRFLCYEAVCEVDWYFTNRIGRMLPLGYLPRLLTMVRAIKDNDQETAKILLKSLREMHQYNPTYTYDLRKWVK